MRRGKKLKSLAFEPELVSQLEKEAKEKGLTFSAYVRLILIERNK